MISHIGSFYGGRSPVIPLASFLRLVRRGALNPSSFRFRLVGALSPVIADNHSELFRELTSLGCLEIQPVVPRQQALDALMESDSLLLADNNYASIGHTVPAKLFEYIRVGRPVLALTVKDSPVERILGMSGVPFVTLSPGMDDQLIDARMIQFLSLPTGPVDLSEQFLSEFNGRNQARTLAGLLDRILDPLSIGSPVYDRNLIKHTTAV
jgi:hypothetical protein